MSGFADAVEVSVIPECCLGQPNRAGLKQSGGFSGRRPKPAPKAQAEAGTAGRAIGDFCVTLAGMDSVSHMINILLIPTAAALLFQLSYIWCYFNRLGRG